MKMHLLSGGRLRMRRSIYFPDAAESEMIELPVSAALLRHRQGNLLFDTGCHPSIADDAEARWGGLAKILMPIMTREDNVLNGLKSVGLAPDGLGLSGELTYRTDVIDTPRVGMLIRLFDTVIRDVAAKAVAAPPR